MARFLAAVVALIGLVLLIAILAPMVVPIDAYKPALETQASEAAGRPIRFGNDIKIRFLPTTAFSISDIMVENAEGFDGGPLLSAKKAEIGVKAFPLLARRVEIQKFVIEEPKINLQRRADGIANWASTTNNGTPSNDNTNSSDSPASEASGTNGDIVSDVRLGDVRIVNGSARYSDAIAGSEFNVEQINLDLKLERFSEPLEANGTMLFQGAPTRLSLILTTIDALRKSEPADLKLEAELDNASLGADLSVTMADALKYSGPISFDAPDLKRLAGLMGTEMQDAPGFDSFSAKGKVDGNETTIRLQQAEIKFDAIEAAGDLNLDWAGEKPKATGALSSPSLDLRPYLPAPEENPEGFPAWSEEKLDLASLRNIDADIDLSAKEILLNDISTDEARLKLVIQNGRLSADIPQLQVYGGGGSGRLVVNARKNIPSFAGYFDFRSVQAQPFSRDFLKHDKLLGLGAMRFEFSASGVSQAAIMRSLDGKGGFDLSDGAIKGFNIVKLVNAARTVYEGGGNPAALSSAINEARRPAEQTDFSKFLSNFTINNGAVSAPTISMEGPFFEMSGRGNVNLPGQEIAINLAPVVATSLDRQKQRFSVPVKVGGTFSSPTVAVDYESLLRGEIENRGRKLLDRVLGDNTNNQDEGIENASSTKEQAGAIVRGLFDRAVKKENDEGKN
ncbi:MAG: AsmA family protein [Pseudomonadota bacterium]